MLKLHFFKGSRFLEKIYLRPLREAFCQNKVWLLNKCVYGLADASLKWYEKVKKTLVSCGGRMSHVDPPIFYWYRNGKLIGLLVVHVDDFLWAGTNEFEKVVIDKLRKEFNIGKEESNNFKYVGLQLSHLYGALKLIIYSDASFGNLSDGNSQGGHIILLCGSNGQFHPISWQSQKIRRIVRSTLAAETLSLADALDNSIFLSTLFGELLYNQSSKCIPIKCIIDSI
ncbi:hypothetical protein SNE40_013155 [Patella caerulea]|uniref:Reverse transcriptase Ty1/copia-type domain-containing protein n=1 Tax=Patella caerulea TaxID=87958 RepID=A0AAN8JMK8_PATCE